MVTDVKGTAEIWLYKRGVMVLFMYEENTEFSTGRFPSSVLLVTIIAITVQMVQVLIDCGMHLPLYIPTVVMKDLVCKIYPSL